MILSKTPLRVSFVGGGTDLPAFFRKNDYGCVISMTIGKYVYLGVNHRFDGKIRLAYARNELIETIDEIQNERMRAALNKTGLKDSIEIFYISDVPKQMGLGGSSSFTVGLLNALYAYAGKQAFPERLAREACEIELEELGNPIGKQDQYAAAIGGLNYIKFWSNGTVTVEPILIDESLILSLMENLLFIYLGDSHDASDVLTDVNWKMVENTEYLIKMREITDQLHKDLLSNDTEQFKVALKENWLLKKKTSAKISSTKIDDLYNKAISCGAEAGKVLGAGGGGFLMMYVPKEKQTHFMAKFSDMKVMRFSISHFGTQIVHKD